MLVEEVSDSIIGASVVVVLVTKVTGTAKRERMNLFLRTYKLIQNINTSGNKKQVIQTTNKILEDIQILLSHAQQRSNVTAALILELALFEF